MNTTLAILFLLASPLQAQTPMTARQYYEELKSANNFTHYKDVYVCFRDDDTPSFAVVGRGSDVIDEMKKAGVTPSKAVLQAKEYLFVETYFKGVANSTEVYYPVVGKEGTEWDLEFNKPLHGRSVYSFNWNTGRYRMMLYALDSSKTLPAYESYGKCEVIHPVDDQSMKLQPLFDNRCFNSKTKEEQKQLVEKLEALPDAEFKQTMQDLESVNAADRLLGTKGCEVNTEPK